MSGKYGEPWEVSTDFFDPWAVSVEKPKLGEYVHVSVDDEDDLPKLQRVVDCINACAGMDDPQAEIERLRAIETAAVHLLDAFGGTVRMPEVDVLYHACFDRGQAQKGVAP